MNKTERLKVLNTASFLKLIYVFKTIPIRVPTDTHVCVCLWLDEVVFMKTGNKPVLKEDKDSPAAVDIESY